MHTEEGLAGIKHDYTALDLSAAAVIAKITMDCIISCCDNRLKLYFNRL